MDRRRFLRTASTTAALAVAATWPDWLSRAFADEGDKSKDGDNKKKTRKEQVKEALARAQRDGRPLLILLIPVNTDNLYERGTILGEFINHGGARGLSDLLCCERVCATVPDVEKAIPGVKVARDPIMLLIEPGGNGAAPRVRTINPNIGAQPSSPTRADGSSGAIDDAIDIRIKQVGDALHNALFNETTTLAARARANRAALSESDRLALTKCVAGEKVDAAIVERGALVLRHTAAVDRKKSADIKKALAEAGKTRVLKVRPVGAKWANSWGCGTSIEGGGGSGIACGMGCVPEKSQRFLWFYTR